MGIGITAVLISCKVGLKELTQEDLDLLDHCEDPLDIGSVCEESVVSDHARSANRPKMVNFAGEVQQSEDDNYKTLVKSQSSISEVTGPFDSLRDREQTDSLRDKDLPDEEEKTSEDVELGKAKETAPPVKVTNLVDSKEEEEEDGVIGDKRTPIERKVTFSEASARSTKSQQEALEDALGPRKVWGQGFLKEIVLRTFPVWGVVVLLILTRIEQIGLKQILTDQEPNFEIHFGTFGVFRLSASIVFALKNILTYPNLSWKYELIYLPFFLFTFISFLTFGLFRKKLKSSPKQVVGVVAERLKNPAMALFGALVLVQLLIRGGTSSPAFVVGTILADWFQEGFVVISPLLGALGSFFSGSTTVSNLTFGDIQAIAAETIGVSATAMLSLQAVGASAGNGICLNNIIAACTVVNLQVGEGKILARTARFVFALTTWATLIMLALYFRF